MGELFRQAVHFDRTLVNDQGTDCNAREGKGRDALFGLLLGGFNQGPGPGPSLSFCYAPPSTVARRGSPPTDPKGQRRDCRHISGISSLMGQAVAERNEQGIDIIANSQLNLSQFSR